ncbi:MAG: hypothetical protein LBN10_07180 [Propionibacteriaceae bacterium]|nr:hypothetical protein [Propionibacteriaceae bacterium]
MTTTTATETKPDAPKQASGLGIAALALALVGTLIFLGASVVFFVSTGNPLAEGQGLTHDEAANVCRIGIIVGLVLDLLGVIGGVLAVVFKRGRTFGAAAVGFGLTILILLGGGLLLLTVSAA